MKIFRYEKNSDSTDHSYITDLSSGYLSGGLDHPFITVVSPLKKIIVLILWMAVSAFLVVGSHKLFGLPDEVAGSLYFITIGITVSSVLNYYKKRESV
ncbi:MAG: hypothetical protein QF835_06680 [Candidatus Marinimicrobia bacterium]|nr:hypothetical protein [Candidatus Neomarinimicrobiota bacterium]MDP6614691.1 hypothetical protein [Candidatus Neomarinimicrobiota bacterium]